MSGQSNSTELNIIPRYNRRCSTVCRVSPYDNAVIESFFNLLKREELHRRSYRSERELIARIYDYINFYNSNRPHRYNNYTSSDDTEKAYEESKRIL